MTTSTITGSAGLCRCAVCKIDLRGRFVFIDSQTEELLGYACEELFGKSVLDFLDSNSKKTVDRVLSDRNHYETHYDYTRLTLINKTGAPIAVDTTISLCFAGGNPVNYQLILKEQDQANRPPNDVVGGMTTEEFVERCLAVNPANRLMSLPLLLGQYSLAERVVIYLIDEGKLEPLAGTHVGSPEPFDFNTTSEPSELHHRVAETGEAFDFCDEVAVKAFREAGIESPREFVTTASIENQPCLLRFLFSEEMSVDVQHQAVARARLAGHLATQLFGETSESHETGNPGIDMKFTIGFLSALGIGALATDCEGKIVGYNPTLVEVLDELSPGDTSDDFVSLLEGDESSGWAALIHEQLKESNSADLRIDLTLPSGEPYLLVIIKLADEAGDQTACWVLVPRPGTNDDNSDVCTETTVWSSLVDGMRPALDELAGGAEELSRDYCSQVKKLNATSLDRLHGAVRAIHQMWADSMLLGGRRTSNSSVAVNLGDLVDEATETVRTEFPDVTIECEHTGLPLIKTSRARLAAVLRNLIANCVRHNQNPSITLKVGATINRNRCRIVVSDDGHGMTRREFQSLFDFYLPPVPRSKTGIPRRSGGAGLGLSRLLMQDMGGKIRGASKEGVGTRLAVMLPQTTENTR